MDKIFLVTGSDGHLGSTIVRQLLKKGYKVRGLRYYKSVLKTPIVEEVFYGDIKDINSLNDFFNCTNAIVIHTAGVVTISKKNQINTLNVNIEGCKNIIAQAKRTKSRLIYISSVHAIQEQDLISPDYRLEYPFILKSNDAIDVYSKSKSIATNLVREASKSPNKINTNIVYPSGILGPGDYGNNHLNLVIKEYSRKKIISYIDGGYNLIDVRDVAKGIINLAINDNLKNKEFLLTGKYITIKHLFNTISDLINIKKPKYTIPLWLLKILNPSINIFYKLKKMPSLYCKYSLKTISKKIEFDNKESIKYLSLNIRPIRETIKDTLNFYSDK